MKTLYLECNTGISGDMIVAALLDLGADEKVLREALSAIRDPGFSVEIKRVSKSGIDCCDFNVILDAAHENHDHDMEYLYGHDAIKHDGEHHGQEEHYDHHDHEEHHHENHDHPHNHEGHDHHDHDHEGHHHDHHHEHRNLGDVISVIDSLNLTDGARNLAVKVFEILAQAEAKAHNRSIGEVHFHEVGALDSIVDIVAAAVCFDNLGLTDVIIPKICEGMGTVRCQHGILPVPVPAVMNIATAYSLPLSVTNRKGELVTPTGAAFAAAVMTSSEIPEIMIPERVGLGAGKREYEIPSILRAVLLKNEKNEEDCIWKLESNIDDSTGEELGFVMDCLMKAGARDVFYTPVYMKKNRPAYLLTVIASWEDITKLEDIIFKETTTIGIRKAKMERRILPRINADVETKYGTVSVKLCEHNGETKVYPEYESVAKLATKTGVAFREIFKTAVEEYAKTK